MQSYFNQNSKKVGGVYSKVNNSASTQRLLHE